MSQDKRNKKSNENTMDGDSLSNFEIAKGSLYYLYLYPSMLDNIPDKHKDILTKNKFINKNNLTEKFQDYCIKEFE